jgi:hypothetical protein
MLAEGLKKKSQKVLNVKKKELIRYNEK